jgi:hypothetical protein
LEHDNGIASCINFVLRILLHSISVSFCSLLSFWSTISFDSSVLNSRMQVVLHEHYF